MEGELKNLHDLDPFAGFGCIIAIVVVPTSMVAPTYWYYFEE